MFNIIHHFIYFTYILNQKQDDYHHLFLFSNLLLISIVYHIIFIYNVLKYFVNIQKQMYIFQDFKIQIILLHINLQFLNFSLDLVILYQKKQWIFLVYFIKYNFIINLFMVNCQCKKIFMFFSYLLLITLNLYVYMIMDHIIY